MQLRFAVRAMQLIHDNLLCDTVNVCTGKSITIDELLDFIVRIIGKKPEVVYKQLPAGDPEKSSGTYKKMVRLLGISLKEIAGIEEGLKETTEYYQREYS